MRRMIELNGAWTLRRDGESDTIPATVPGCVHTDLLAAGAIPDPFVGQNEDAVRWIYKERWIYRRDFILADDELARERVHLCCEGLDTVARVILNGRLLGSADNMFRQWEFDARPLLVAGTNTLEIRFDSPLEAIERRQKVRPVSYPIAPFQIAAFSQIRKAACSFGWDWGPCLPTSGIWQSIYLRAFDTGRLLDVSIRQDHAEPGVVGLVADIQAEVADGCETFARITLTYGNERIARATCRLPGGQGSVDLRIEAPRLWWPRGMGDQPLYRITVELCDQGGQTRIDIWERRIGLRTLRLDRGADRWGNAFSFSVNDVPFFAKGANWVPADALLTRVTPDIYRQRLAAAAEANMNMIRVWGGGIYEPDVFYDLCDELGLCVWQDFMFACAPYPLDVPAFVENVEVEICQQIRRLRHHACLALWCGNNELEMCGFVAETADAMHMALADYRAFFDERIPALLAEHAPGQSYWPGSPFKEPGEVYNPDVWIDSPGRGDAHIWGVWHSEQPIEAYRESRHRFISEFGFHGLPCPDTVRRFAGPDDMRLDSPVMRHHQREHEGNARLMRFLLAWFREPRDFEATLWCSQILQALALKTACEHWRRASPRTMGTLYWQLNDNWPVTSCATIDYFGQWKAAHHLAKRFFAPLMVSAVAVPDTGEVQVHVTSDLAERTDGRLQWRLADLRGNTLAAGKESVQVPARSSQTAMELNLRKHLDSPGPRNVLLWIELAAKHQPISRNLVLFARPKHLELEDPGIRHRVEAAGKKTYSVSLVTRRPALWVWLELPGEPIQCSDSFFHLAKGRTKRIRVQRSGTAKRTPEWVARHLKINSLFDTYAHDPSDG